MDKFEWAEQIKFEDYSEVNLMNVKAQEYKSWIEKFVNCNDNREINYQNDVVKRLLEKLFEEYDIVYVDKKGPCSKRHDYYAYSGMYGDVLKGENEKPTTPDLLVCKDWSWYNKNNESIKYIATVEVKSPFLEAIYKMEKQEYPERVKIKVEQHLAATKIKKVIYTDTFKWDFYIGTYENYETIELIERVKKGTGYTFKWHDDFEKQFEKLKEKLKEFLTV